MINALGHIFKYNEVTKIYTCNKCNVTLYRGYEINKTEFDIIIKYHINITCDEMIKNIIE